MSLIPEFELGLWNAWIVIVLGFILPWIPSFFSSREVVNKRMGKIKWSLALIITQVIIMPFPITWIVAAIAIVVIAVVGTTLLIYFGKIRKNKRELGEPKA